MARMYSISSIGVEINNLEEVPKKAQAKTDATSAKILELREVKHDLESRKVMEAINKSGRNLQE